MSEFKIKVSVDLQTDDLEGKLKALGKDQEIKLKVDSPDLDKIEAQLKGLKKSFQDAFKLNSNVLGGSKTKSNISSLVSEYKDLYNTISKLQKQIDSGKLGEDSIARTKSQISSLSSEIDKMYLKANDNQRKSLDLFNAKQMNKGIVDMNNYLNKIDLQASNIKKSIGDIDLGKLSSSSKNQLNDVLQIVEKIQAEAKDIKIDIDVGNSLKQLNDAQDTVSKIQKESKKASHSGLKGFWDDYKSSIMAYSIGDMLGDFTMDAIRGAVSTVMDLDKAFTDLRKVSNTPIEGKYYDSIRKQAIETAKEVGMSSTDVINATATAMQAGASNMKEAMEIAKQSMILANVGDMDSTSAAQSIAAITNSFGLSPLKEVQIQQKGVTKTTTELANAMDMMNHASNNYAIDSAGLSSALADSGAVLNSYGVSLGDSIALITSANESLQDPNKVATGLKSMAINLAGLQTSAKNGDITLNKTAKSLSEIAEIDIYADKQKGQVKDMVTILDELQGKWSSLSEEQQLALSNAVAGKTNAATFQALMGNYETFKKIRDEFAQGLHFESAANEKQNSPYVQKCA